MICPEVQYDSDEAMKKQNDTQGRTTSGLTPMYSLIQSPMKRKVMLVPVYTELADVYRAVKE